MQTLDLIHNSARKPHGITKADKEAQNSYIDYDVRAVRANVQYILKDSVSDEEVLQVNVAPDIVQSYSKDELLDLGVEVVEPWSKDVIYSPVAIIHLENNNIFHPKPLIFITFPLLTFIFVIYLIILIVISTGKGVWKGVKYINKRRSVQKFVNQSAKIVTVEDIIQNDTGDEEGTNENQ